MEKRIISRALMFVASEVVCVWQLISGEFGGVHVRCSRSGGGKSAPRWQRRACTKLQRRWGGHSTPLAGVDAHRRRNDKAPEGIGQGCRSDSDNSGSLGRRWAGLGNGLEIGVSNGKEGYLPLTSLQILTRLRKITLRAFPQVLVGR